MASIRSRVDMSTSSLTRFCSSVTQGEKHGSLCYSRQFYSSDSSKHSYPSPSPSGGRPLWQPGGAAQRRETRSFFSSCFLSISCSCFLEENNIYFISSSKNERKIQHRTREELAVMMWSYLQCFRLLPLLCLVSTCPLTKTMIHQ